MEYIIYEISNCLYQFELADNGQDNSFIQLELGSINEMSRTVILKFWKTVAYEQRVEDSSKDVTINFLAKDFESLFMLLQHAFASNHIVKLVTHTGQFGNKWYTHFHIIKN